MTAVTKPCSVPTRIAISHTPKKYGLGRRRQIQRTSRDEKSRRTGRPLTPVPLAMWFATGVRPRQSKSLARQTLGSLVAAVVTKHSHLAHAAGSPCSTSRPDVPAISVADHLQSAYPQSIPQPSSNPWPIERASHWLALDASLALLDVSSALLQRCPHRWQK